MNGHRYTTTLGGQTLTLETGKVAKLVSGAVTVRYGDTVLLVTAQSSDTPSNLDFFPLTVEFEERHYAVGQIPGSFQRREGRPGEKAILGARITDRQIRPLFPKGYKNETQVIITVQSADQENLPDILGAIGASAALSISETPWEGPTACVKVGYINGQFAINPTFSQMKNSTLDLVVAGTRDAIIMVEAGAQQVDEELLVQALEFAHAQMQPIIDLIERMKAEVGKAKQEFSPPVDTISEIYPEIKALALQLGLREAVLTSGKKARKQAVSAIKAQVVQAKVPETEAEGAAEHISRIASAIDKAQKELLRSMIVDEDLRIDGRNSVTVRPIWIEAPALPRTHGSALFTRGETQVLGTTTLGTERDEILVDDLGIDTSDKFLLHYNFPPYSTGEVKRMGGQSRRELGHGNLAKRALRSVLPEFNDFPYVIRVVGDVLESNGSSSMATVCAGCLSLMDAGVPIKASVAGVAMGLVMEGEKYRVLTDILGDEDHLGDMDFKVCGTAEGVTALQMDIKIKGITPSILREALAQAKAGRMHILGKMQEALAKPRPDLSQYAPRILTIKIPVDFIGKVIGPGGKNVRELEAMGAQVTIDDDGTTRIYSADALAAQAAYDRIKAQTYEPQIGDEFEGKVVKIAPFGAFINLYPGQDGMLHISQMAETRVQNVEDVLSIGDTIRVKVAGMDKGKLSLVRPELEDKLRARTPRR